MMIQIKIIRPLRVSDNTRYRKCTALHCHWLDPEAQIPLFLLLPFKSHKIDSKYFNQSQKAVKQNLHVSKKAKISFAKLLGKPSKFYGLDMELGIP